MSLTQRRAPPPGPAADPEDPAPDCAPAPPRPPGGSVAGLPAAANPARARPETTAWMHPSNRVTEQRMPCDSAMALQIPALTSRPRSANLGASNLRDATTDVQTGTHSWWRSLHNRRLPGRRAEIQKALGPSPWSCCSAPESLCRSAWPRNLRSVRCSSQNSSNVIRPKPLTTYWHTMTSGQEVRGTMSDAHPYRTFSIRPK
mmetsp:Transcript_4620/g.11198  ORF Transcript_4620/g.11198 Transcript_4620/m.11198 type:complete len:202 (-) Transcript_4620:695-1300(-)